MLKEPVWTWEIPWYFFVGGLGGAADALAFACRLAGNRVLARRLGLVATIALSASPALLVKDLGRPERFLNMLRVFKVTSPMSVGSWALAGGGSLTGTAFALSRLGVLPRTRLAAEAGAAAFGLPVATYTAALVADTAVPVWHEARRTLPFVFAAGSAASAGAAGMIAAPAASAGPARRLALLGGTAELVAAQAMERRLGVFLGEPYHEGEAGRYARLARVCTAAGLLVTARAGRRRLGAVAGGGLLLAGSAFERWAVFRAGFQSARDPRYVVEPQRARLAGAPPARP